MRVAGVVVLYNADEDKVIENIKSYISSIELLIAVDNSDQAEEKCKLIGFLKSKNAIYVKNSKNLGIAQALNTGAKKAIEYRYEWLLMMDQDSKSSEKLVETLFSVTKVFNISEIGIIAPNYLDKKVPSFTSKIEQVFTVITSGSLLNLNAFRKTGLFREDLFIDFVDHEYCLRLQKNRFKVLINYSAILYHQPGSLTCYEILGRRICTTNHNYIRRYYITRNRLEVTNKFRNDFPEFCVTEKKMNFIEMAKVVLFEKNKVKKIKSFILGYFDYKRRKFGEFRYKY